MDDPNLGINTEIPEEITKDVVNTTKEVVNTTEDDKIVHLILYSHLDAGWQLTFDTYYTGR